MDQNGIIGKRKSKSVAKLQTNTYAIVFSFHRTHVSRIMLINCINTKSAFFDRVPFIEKQEQQR